MRGYSRPAGRTCWGYYEEVTIRLAGVHIPHASWFAL